jgi:hypothetical protein
LNAIADARMNDGQAFIPVTLDDLWACLPPNCHDRMEKTGW